MGNFFHVGGGGGLWWPAGLLLTIRGGASGCVGAYRRRAKAVTAYFSSNQYVCLCTTVVTLADSLKHHISS